MRGEGKVGGKWNRSYGGHMSPSKHAQTYIDLHLLPGRHSLGGFEPKRNRHAVFFSPTLCSSPGPSSSTSTILEKVDDYESAMDAVSECIAECSVENLLDLLSYCALGLFPYCCHHLPSSSTFSIFGNRLFQTRCSALTHHDAGPALASMLMLTC